MTSDEINALRADLAYRYSEYTSIYFKAQQRGYSDRTNELNILVLSGYVYLIEIWDIEDSYNTNLLTPEAMNCILRHINIILNAYYTYKFD